MNQGLRQSNALQSMSWRAAAKCRDIDPDVFYPLGRGRSAFEGAEVAKAICQGCPSREPCLRFALSAREDLGVWGGMSAEERREIIRSRRRQVAS